MFTAQNAKSLSCDDLDARIEKAVKEAISCGHKSASIRVYIEDSYVHTIWHELNKRGFTDIHVPDICLKGDVSFSWEDKG